MAATPSLRERLLEEFGEDLPIRGGAGEQGAPIVVPADQLQDAVDTQTRVLRRVAQGGRVAWRLVGQEVIAPGQGIVRSTIESVAARAGEFVRHRETVYFVLEALRTDAGAESLPAPSGFVDPRSGIRLPAQLGWLHLRQATDDEPAQPGLGWSVAYESPALESTVRVYDRQERQPTDDVESARVIDEFRSAVADVLADSPGSTIRHQALFRDPAGSGRCFLAIMDWRDPAMTAVLLTVRHGCFVKARLTFDASEREFGRMAHESMEAFVDAVRPVA